VNRKPLNFSSAVSVCLATYNGERFILDQINSILDQMEDTDELVISDNGSNDGTLKLLANLTDVRVKILTCHKLGVVANFENALRHANNDLLVLSDQDDVWRPGRLAAARASLEHHDLSIVGLTFVNQKLEPMSRPSAVRQPAPSLLSTILRNGYTGCGMAFRKELLHAALPFPSRVAMHDWWIAVVALGIGASIDISTEEMILYRRHDDNVSVTGNLSNNSLVDQFCTRLHLVSGLINRLSRYHTSNFFSNLRFRC